MLTGVTIWVLLLGAVLGSFFYSRRRHQRKMLAEYRMRQEEARIKKERDRARLAEINEKLKHEHFLPGVEYAHFIELDDQGRTLYDRLTENLPQLPPMQLYGQDLNTIECPDFYSYRIPERTQAA